MQSIAIYFHRQTRFGLPLGVIIKFLISTLLLTYAAFYFTTGEWVLLAVLSTLALAITDRILNINSIATDLHRPVPDTVYCDGGAFSQKQQLPANTNIHSNTHSVVHDGGSFERSSLNAKAKK